MRDRNIIETSPMPYDKLILEVLLDIRSLLAMELPVVEPIVTVAPYASEPEGTSNKPSSPKAITKRKRIKKNTPTLVCV